uniref:Cation channel sperm-associated targeting subunit tau C2 domain-containing protein n=1 Tax=Spermophilus dauricus TaxID=99837 RepID=A0A8C9QQB8_SPEDA
TSTFHLPIATFTPQVLPRQIYSQYFFLFLPQLFLFSARNKADMLRKTLQGSESEELEIAPSELPSLVPFGDVVGCLAVHVKNCRNFAQRITSQSFIDLFIQISVNNIMKSTKRRILLLRSSAKSTIVRFDEIKYFSVQVPRRQDDTRNNISLELMQHSKTEVYPVLLGNAEVHLYEVIQVCIKIFFLTIKTFLLEVEFMFSYGNFGYGFSHQLKPLQKIVEPSMFMNIAPPPERTDPLTNVITPRPVEYPAFLSPDLNVTVGTPTTSKETNQTPVVRLEKLEQQPRERLEKMKKEYRNLGTWKEKVDYLENILNPKLEPKESSVIGIIHSSTWSFEYFFKRNIIVINNNEPEITPSELLGDDNKEGVPTSTSSLLDQDYSILATPESVMSTPLPSDSLLPSIPRQEKTLLDKIPFFSEGQSEVMPEERRSIPFLSDAKSDDTHRSILKAISALSEVAFSSKEYFPSHFRPEYIELKPKYQDCSDRFEDLQEPSMQHLNKTTSRVRLLAKSPDDSHIQAKQAARPYTAPEPNKRREYYTGKFTSPRVVSSGLANTNDTTPDYEIRKMRSKKRLKEDIEKCLGSIGGTDEL